MKIPPSPAQGKGAERGGELFLVGGPGFYDLRTHTHQSNSGGRYADRVQKIGKVKACVQNTCVCVCESESEFELLSCGI